MKGAVKTVFPGNNSVEGFYSYYESGLSTMERIYILKGGPGTGKSSFMRRLGEAFRERGLDIEVWQCSSDNDSLDGLLLPSLKTAFVDGTAPHVVEPRYPGVREIILNFGDFWQSAELSKEREAIISLSDRVSAAFHEAYRRLEVAGECDARFLALRETAGETSFGENALVEEIFGEKKAVSRHFFGAAVTPAGVVDLTLALCRDSKRRFFLKGRRGLGQQAYFSAVLEAAQKHGLDTEIYHGHLQPKEIVAVLLPALDTAVAAAETIPAEEIRKGDRLIVFSEARQDKQSKEERQAEKEREAAIDDAVKQLALGHELHDALEKYYIGAMDFTAVERREKEIFQKIMKNASKDGKYGIISLR